MLFNNISMMILDSLNYFFKKVGWIRFKKEKRTLIFQNKITKKHNLQREEKKKKRRFFQNLSLSFEIMLRNIKSKDKS